MSLGVKAPGEAGVVEFVAERLVVEAHRLLAANRPLLRNRRNLVGFAAVAAPVPARQVDARLRLGGDDVLVRDETLVEMGLVHRDRRAPIRAPCRSTASIPCAARRRTRDWVVLRRTLCRSRRCGIGCRAVSPSRRRPQRMPPMSDRFRIAWRDSPVAARSSRLSSSSRWRRYRRPDNLGKDCRNCGSLE